MTDQRKLIFGASALVLTLALAVFITYWVSTKSKSMVYVRSNELFEKFTYAQELEKKFQSMESQRKFYLDSLGIRLNSMRNASPAERMALQKEFLQKKDFFQNDNLQTVERFNKLIWKQLNQYLQQFCEKEGYSVVLGNDGSGAVLAGDKSHDVTEAAISYCNAQYTGAGK